VSDDNPMQDFNEQIIEEFRANEGRVGAPFEGAQMVLLHHAGAKTGTERVTPLVYRAEGDAAVVFASKAGAPDKPDWFHHLRANPETTVEIGTDTRSVRARVAEGDERDRIWEAQKADAPQFAEYEANTDRVIPVVILEST
jgi:deazaflavin-dependent oxidoreductase (nitroreductase family)